MELYHARNFRFGRYATNIRDELRADYRREKRRCVERNVPRFSREPRHAWFHRDNL